MPLTITFLGHSGFILDDGKHKLVIDPFLTGNDLASHKPRDIRCNYVALTHGHFDHFGDTLDIASANDATVIANWEICDYISEQSQIRVDPGNIGGRVYTDFGYVAFTPALHSSSLKGRYMGIAAGLIISMGGKKVYHCGDTGLFSDMKLIGEVARPDVAMIPCGDRFTMGPKLATLAAQYIGAPLVIPVHYKTFPLLVSDISDFKPAGIEVKPLEPGQALTLD